uniref:Uncharacterized protein n=1 Tax=Megaselia scalaris TaxID=36166 RepID=T1H0S2_MEGSC
FREKIPSDNLRTDLRKRGVENKVQPRAEAIVSKTKTLSKRSELKRQVILFESRKTCLLEMYSPQIQLEIEDLVVRKIDGLSWWRTM